MNPEHARIVSLGSPNNNFLYIDFLEPFSFPPFYVSEKTGALHDTAQSPGSAPLFVFFFFFPVVCILPAVYSSSLFQMNLCHPVIHRQFSYQHRTSWPFSVTSTMISHWADGFPSSV